MTEKNTWSFKNKDNLTPIHELPDPFIKPDGNRVQNKSEWPQQRAYLKAMLEHYFYGSIPPPPKHTVGEVLFSRPVYGGKAIAETVRITFDNNISFNADIIRPCKEGKVPVITWNQFKGRHGSPAEEDIVCNRGYAIAEFDKEQLAADSGAAFSGPLAKAYPEYGWGTIAMWSWGHSRIADYLATTDYADMNKLVATGHSRGGKVAMCAAIFDERFAVCAANGSGCGGAGCLRFLGGRLGEGTALCETAGSIMDAFPFWFADEFGRYGARSTEYCHANCNEMSGDLQAAAKMFSGFKVGTTKDEDKLPFDLHFLRALIAPRALITTDGLSDAWANTFGTQITWRAAQEVFNFLDVPGNNAMCFRDGPHEYQLTDWATVADFCDMVFFDKKPKTNIVMFEAPTAQSPQAKLMSMMDWRKDKLHYTWEMPSI
ncbi:MAG: hypothetical protein RR087_08695 [Oscillospiraceae bacterium]